MLKGTLVATDAPGNLIDFVNGFRYKLFRAGLLAREKLGQAQGKMKTYYDRGATRHEFSPGDQVLVVAPLVTSPFQARFVGPYTVSERVSEVNYRVSTPGRRKASQLYHVNLLKPYHQREGHGVGVAGAEVCPVLVAHTCEVVQETSGVPEPDDSLRRGRLKNAE